MPTPRERVLAVLAGEKPDRVPFIIWDNKIPAPEVEKRLLDLDACIIVKSMVWREAWQGVDIRREALSPNTDGNPRTRTVYRTGVGELSTIHIQQPFSTWQEKPLFESASDFDALEALLKARSYTPDFDTFRRADQRYPGRCLARSGTVHTPLHEVIYDLMGIETFCLEWADNRDRVLRLIDLMTSDVEARVRLMADSPALQNIIDANTEVSVVGLELYREFFVPHIERACAILHAKGKLAGAHLDGNNRLLASDVANTALDYIESFTPPPDCNLTLTEAQRMWPDKTLMINFPSSLHLGGAEAVRHHARELMREGARDGRRFIMGVTEDVPNRGLDTIIPLAEEVAAYKIGS